MDQERQSLEIAHEAERIMQEAEESGRRLRAALAQCQVQPEEFFADYSKLRPGVLDIGVAIAKQMVDEDFPQPVSAPAVSPKFRNMI